MLVLVHEDLVAPESLEGMSEQEISFVKTEYDVVRALENLGHEVRQLGVRDELRVIRETVEAFEPQVVFNMLEEFGGEAVYDQNVVSYLELLRVPYTGCNPRGLVLARDKALSKKLLAYHRIGVPRFFTVRRGRKVRRSARHEFPLIVKSLNEESSRGIAKASLVHDDEHLSERVAFVHESIGTDAIVEQFIDGREIYVGVLGNDRLKTLPPIELVVKERDEGEPLIATEALKHDTEYQKRHGVDIRLPRLSDKLHTALARTAKRAYRTLHIEGYARIDFRVDGEGRPFVLEANPNPDIARGEEFATSAKRSGTSYEKLMQRIVNLGLQR